MARKKIDKPLATDLLPSFIKMFVPANILEHFEVYKVIENKDRYVLELREKEDLIPEVLCAHLDKVVLDGYCNPTELLSIGFSLKPVYLRIYRRRWKFQKQDDHYSNTYDLKLKGYKIVPEMGFFLKE